MSDGYYDASYPPSLWDTAAAFDPSAHSVAEIKSYIADHPDEAADVLDAERAGKARAALVFWLTEQIEEVPSE